MRDDGVISERPRIARAYEDSLGDFRAGGGAEGRKPMSRTAKHNVVVQLVAVRSLDDDDAMAINPT